jgi:tetrahydromethanopterin S-methyltransferase subunit H
MFRFDKEQLVVDIAGVKMGGQPGEYPTVLAGTIFYGGHKIISDEKAGDFDKDAAEGLIKTMEEMSDVTGNPCVIQNFGATAEAMVKEMTNMTTARSSCIPMIMIFFFILPSLLL